MMFAAGYYTIADNGTTGADSDATGQTDARNGLIGDGCAGRALSACKNAVEKEHAPRLALRLEQGEDVVLADRALHVPDDRPARVVHELDADLRDAAARAGAAEDLCAAQGGEIVRAPSARVRAHLDHLGELDVGF
jgi:hypothetical protein